MHSLICLSYRTVDSPLLHIIVTASDLESSTQQDINIYKQTPKQTIGTHKQNSAIHTQTQTHSPHLEPLTHCTVHFCTHTAQHSSLQSLDYQTCIPLVCDLLGKHSRPRWNSEQETLHKKHCNGVDTQLHEEGKELEEERR